MTRRDEIVAAARLWIGTPYRHQASLIGVGCDCLGLVRGVWRMTVGEEPEAPPPYTADWAEAKPDEALLGAALRWFVPVASGEMSAGDLIVFRWRDGSPAKHLGNATSSTRMIHAHDAANVCEVQIGTGWRRRIAGVFAFPGV